MSSETKSYAVVLMAHGPVDKVALRDAALEIEGCVSATELEMDEDDLREAVEFELEERPEVTTARLERAAGTTDVDEVADKTLREVLWAGPGENVLAVDVALESNDGAQRLVSFAKAHELSAIDELSGRSLEATLSGDFPPK